MSRCQKCREVGFRIQEAESAQILVLPCMALGELPTLSCSSLMCSVASWHLAPGRRSLSVPLSFAITNTHLSCVAIRHVIGAFIAAFDQYKIVTFASASKAPAWLSGHRGFPSSSLPGLRFPASHHPLQMKHTPDHGLLGAVAASHLQ